MKKIVLTTLMVGALLATSCKSEKKEVKKAAEEVKTEVKKDAKQSLKTVKAEIETALEGVKIPSFSNDAVEANLKAYAEYAKDYIDAKGNLGKVSGLAAKGKKLLDEGRDMVSKLSKEEQDLYAKAMAKIQSKMAPAK